jgi:hypothetical protein
MYCITQRILNSKECLFLNIIYLGIGIKQGMRLKIIELLEANLLALGMLHHLNPRLERKQLLTKLNLQ